MTLAPPTIELSALRLRPLRPEDAAPWHRYLSDPHVTELTSYPKMSLSDVQSMLAAYRTGFASDVSCKWAIALQSDDSMIGTCGFNNWSRSHGWAELAYELACPHWGRGIITQAVSACLRWAFTDAGFNRVHTFVMVGNVRSERVLQRAHFTREGCLRSYRICRGEPRDFGLFSILRRDWEKGISQPLFQNIDCLIFKVPDIDAALSFYRDKLGLPLAWRTQTGLALQVGESELVLSTEHSRPPETDIKVASAEDAARHFVAAGGSIVAGPFDIKIGKCVVVADPWGNQLVLLDSTKGTLKTDADGFVID